MYVCVLRREELYGIVHAYLRGDGGTSCFVPGSISFGTAWDGTLALDHAWHWTPDGRLRLNTIRIELYKKNIVRERGSGD